MDFDDRLILENELAEKVGGAMAAWARRNSVPPPVSVHALLSSPTCYFDDDGRRHAGPLITVEVRMMEDGDDDDGDDYDD